MIVLGFNGTGKTTFVRDILIGELKKGGRGLVITPDDREWLTLEMVHNKFPERISRYVGARRMIFYEPSRAERMHKGMKNTLEYISEHYSKGLLIFDDCRAYLRSLTASEVHNLLIRRRQREIDIIAVGHGFTEVPPKFFTFADKIILFQTKDNIYKRKDDLRDFQAMEEAQLRVNAQAEKNPHYYEIINQ